MHTHLRFNIIFHGLLGLLKPKDRLGWDVYVPIPEECGHSGGMHGPHEPHVAMWGTPYLDPSHPLKGLEPIPHENFTIDMHYEHSFRDPCEFDSNECIVLKGLIPQPPFIWSKISLPLPTVIRKYRAIESAPAANPDPATVAALDLQPRLVHQVIVFSYVNVRGPIVLLGDRLGSLRDLRQSDKGTSFLNFGIYYQPKKEMTRRHNTIPFDQMFKVRSNGTAVPIQVASLTQQGVTTSVAVDGPPTNFSPTTGLTPKDLATLAELSSIYSVNIQGAAPSQGQAHDRLMVLDVSSTAAVFSNFDPTSCGQSTGIEGS